MSPVDCVNSDITATCPPPVRSGVEVAGGVSAAKWFVAIVTPRHEKSIAAKLAECGVEAYVAVQKEMHLWANGRRKLVDRVVIPSIVFIHCTEAKRREVVKLPYILRFMVNRAARTLDLSRPIATVSQAEIDKLMFMLGQSDVAVNFVPTLYRVNDNVRVVRGPFRNLIGEITRNSDGTHSLSVGLSLLGGAVVRISPEDVEPLGR